MISCYFSWLKLYEWGDILYKFKANHALVFRGYLFENIYLKVCIEDMMHY